MRTKLRSKSTLLFVVFGLLLAVPAVALASDVLFVDGDAITSNADTTIDLGTVDPGQAIKASNGSDYQVSFKLQCDTQGSNRTHVTAGKALNLSYSAGDSTLSGAAVSATDARINVPTSWPTDSQLCPTSPGQIVDDTGNSTLTMTAPKPSGKKDVTVAFEYAEYNVNTDGSLGSLFTGEDDKAIQGGFPGTKTVKYTMTVRNLPPAISSVDGLGTVVVGDQKEYKVNASDPNEDTLTYTNTVSGPATFVTGTANTSTPKLNFTGTGSVTLTSTVKDTANQTATKTTTIMVNSADSQAPTSTASATVPNGTGTSPYTGGTSWTNKDVLVTLNATDNAGGSDVKELTYSATGADPISPAVTKAKANLPTSFTIDAEGTTTISYFAKDNNGNVETENTFVVNIDKTKPVISASAKTMPGGATYTGGWTNKDVEVSFTCSDPLSGTNTNTVAGATKSTSGACQSVTNTGTCTDKAGNTADSATFSGIDIDKVKPEIVATGTVTGTAGNLDWYKSAIDVEFQASDGLSGFSDKADPYPFKQSSGTQQGDSVNVNSGTVTDRAGNVADSASSGPFKVDYTKPTLSPSVSPNPVQLYGSATVSAGASDGESGVASQPCGSVDASSVTAANTSRSVSCTVTDVAGNFDTKSATYTVVYGTTFGGVLQPINLGTQRSIFKLGSTIPVKFKLMDGTLPISNAVANLSVKKQDNTVEGAVNEAVLTDTPTPGNTFRYDATGQQYILNLSTKTTYTYTNLDGTGVTFSAGTWVLTIKLNDGTTRTATIDIGR
jgi:hypothetical protein